MVAPSRTNWLANVAVRDAGVDFSESVDWIGVLSISVMLVIGAAGGELRSALISGGKIVGHAGSPTSAGPTKMIPEGSNEGIHLEVAAGTEVFQLVGFSQGRG